MQVVTKNGITRRFPETMDEFIDTIVEEGHDEPCEVTKYLNGGLSSTRNIQTDREGTFYEDLWADDSEHEYNLEEFIEEFEEAIKNRAISVNLMND